MKIKRKNDGKVFEFNIVNFARGEWAIELVKVDGDHVMNGMGDPIYRTEREAKKVARKMAEFLEYHYGLGWCMKPML